MRVGGRGVITYSFVAANGLCCWWGGRRIWVLVAAAAISSSSSSSHCRFWRIIPLVHWRQMVSILLLLVLLTSPPWVKPMHLRAFFAITEMKDPWEIYLLLIIIVCGCFVFSQERHCSLSNEDYSKPMARCQIGMNPILIHVGGGGLNVMLQIAVSRSCKTWVSCSIAFPCQAVCHAFVP